MKPLRHKTSEREWEREVEQYKSLNYKHTIHRTQIPKKVNITMATGSGNKPTNSQQGHQFFVDILRLPDNGQLNQGVRTLNQGYLIEKYLLVVLSFFGLFSA